MVFTKCRYKSNVEGYPINPIYARRETYTWQTYMIWYDILHCLGGDFKDFDFLPLPGEMIQFD